MLWGDSCSFSIPKELKILRFWHYLKICDFWSTVKALLLLTKKLKTPFPIFKWMAAYLIYAKYMCTLRTTFSEGKLNG